MSAVTPQELVRLSRAIASRIDSRIQVAGVTSADGGTGRAELMVTIEGCHNHPCTFTLNVDRSDRAHAEGDLDQQLTAALAEHLAARDV